MSLSRRRRLRDVKIFGDDYKSSNSKELRLAVRHRFKAMHQTRTFEYRYASRGSPEILGRTIERRKIPSRANPDFSRTREDAELSISQVAQTRQIDGSERAHSTIALETSVAKPLPQKLRFRRYPYSTECPLKAQDTDPITTSSGGNVINQLKADPDSHSFAR